MWSINLTICLSFGYEVAYNISLTLMTCYIFQFSNCVCFSLCYDLLPGITGEAARVTHHASCCILDILILPRHLCLLNDALACHAIPYTPVWHASTLCVNYSERPTGHSCTKHRQCVWKTSVFVVCLCNINGLVNCSSTLLISL